VVCPLAPPFFTSIGEWCEEFPQLSDDAVRRLLEECRRRTTAADLVRSEVARI
jgi:predicted phosphoribosyltransferase